MKRSCIGTGFGRAVAGGLFALSLAAGVPSGLFAETAGQGTAEQGTPVSQLIVTMQIDQVIDLLRAEGLDYGASLEEQMFPGAGGAEWKAEVAGIYDVAEMKQRFADRLSAELQGKEGVAEMDAFFASDLGRKVLQLELEARRALMDDETESAASLAWADLEAAGGKRVEMIRAFAEVNDLVESNVMGTLNSNFAFYKGMAGAGGLEAGMSEEDMLAEVWGQEADIRAQTEDWVYPYLNLAYGPLTDAELQAYIDFSATPAGQVLNGALFAAFDAVFTPISRALGTAAAQQLQGQDI